MAKANKKRKIPLLTESHIFEIFFSIRNDSNISTLVSFSQEFPNFLVPSDQETKIKLLLINETDHFNGQKAFREIVSVLIDKSDFLSKSASQLKKKVLVNNLIPNKIICRRLKKEFPVLVKEK
ncbi:hypothetical protein BpHYR1_023989 [Brachionus plicatilis]|uniref:Uncharacterized protein n=1 Tax=Brachionus plicatilis TaxID=10195 RepID=A0A3M7SH45_BRAPC|nr:hypothetical protein BpHYR1_023989 [Brachionus plicatilis]